MEIIRIIFAWSAYLIAKAIFYIYVASLWCILAVIALFLIAIHFFGFVFGPIVGFIWLFISGSLLEAFHDLVLSLFGVLGEYYEKANQKINMFFTEEVPS